MPRIFTFGEGVTEKVVFDSVVSNLFPDHTLDELIAVGGKSQFAKRIRETVESELLPNKHVYMLVFRDIDVGETRESIIQSFQDFLSELLDTWDLTPVQRDHERYANIFIWDQPSSETAPGLRFVLHLADQSALNLSLHLRNHTTDSYVLAAGLEDAVLERFGRNAKVNCPPQDLSNLIIQNIPNQFNDPGITFDEGKDYLAAYLCASRFWVANRTEERARLVRVILDRAWKYNQKRYEDLFVSWRVAIEEAFS